MTSRLGLAPSACTGTRPKPRLTTAPNPFCCFCPRYLGLFPDDTEAARPARRRGAPHRQLDRGCSRLVRLDARRLFELLDRHADRRWGARRSRVGRALPLFAHCAGRLSRHGRGALPRLGAALWAQAGRAVARGGRTDARVVGSGRARIGAGGFADPRRAGGWPATTTTSPATRSLASKICWRRARSTRWAISFCWRATISFRRAAKKIVEPLVGELLDPYADPAGGRAHPTIAGPSPIPRWTTRCARCWRDNPPSRKHRGRWSFPKSESVANWGWASAAT